MALVGFHYDRMCVEKKKPATGKINVNNNLVIKDAKEAKLNMGASKQKGVEFSFHFKTKFDPGIAELDLEGAVVYMGAEDKIKEIVDMWSQDKKIPPMVMEEAYNFILAKCNIQAFILEKDMALPAHIPLPKVTSKN